MLFMLVALMQQITTEQLQAELGSSPDVSVIVDDAIKRWSLKSGQLSGHDVMAERIAIVFDMGPERCVLLRLRARAVGGSPVYCYSQQSSKLVRSFDDVE